MTAPSPKRPALASKNTLRSSTGSTSTLSPRIAHPPSSSLEKATAKRRARNLLRDYYGLGGNEASAAGRDPLDMDSPNFEPLQLFEQLYTTASLVDMLKKENEVLNEIRELDSEKSALVYNHHHELIDASDKIQKMKAKAESLDVSLDALRSSFETISQLSTSLALVPKARRKRKSYQQDSEASDLTNTTFDPILHLPPILDLPQQLRHIETLSERSALWGEREPVLSAWEEAGVGGIKDIALECREVLKRARRPSEVQKSP